MHQELAAEGFKGFHKHKKPLLLPWHIEACQKFSKEHLDWEQLDVFCTAHILFSDKSKFIVHGSDGKQYCCRWQGERALDEKNVQKTIRHFVGKGQGKGKLNVWGCITPWGVGKLVWVRIDQQGKVPNSKSSQITFWWPGKVRFSLYSCNLQAKYLCTSWTIRVPWIHPSM